MSLRKRENMPESPLNIEADLARMMDPLHTSRLVILGEMAAELAHELQQPLCAILTASDASLRLVREDPPDIQKLTHVLEMIATQVQRAVDTGGRIRDLARKQPPVRTCVDARDLLTDCMRFTDPRIKQHNVRVHVDMPQENLAVSVDRIQVQQVVLNLVCNAIDAMKNIPEDDRTLTVTLRRNSDTHIEIEVRDTGHGFSSKDLERLFYPFFTTKPDGLGIGLSVSRSIVEMHGGELWARPNRNDGSAFTFTLPVAQTQLTNAEYSSA